MSPCSHEPTFGARQTTSQFGTHVASVDVVERINACCTSLASALTQTQDSHHLVAVRFCGHGTGCLCDRWSRGPRALGQDCDRHFRRQQIELHHGPYARPCAHLTGVQARQSTATARSLAGSTSSTIQGRNDQGATSCVPCAAVNGERVPCGPAESASIAISDSGGFRGAGSFGRAHGGASPPPRYSLVRAGRAWLAAAPLGELLAAVAATTIGLLAIGCIQPVA